jgi:hypothetical protein
MKTLNVVISLVTVISLALVGAAQAKGPGGGMGKPAARAINVQPRHKRVILERR